jgi:hypothetical protein
MAVAAWAGSFAAAGADASGYLSQARLWKARALHVCPDVAREAALQDAWTFAPLGFRPATRPRCVVPTYAPGLPMLMALAMFAGGDRAAYVVVPLTGALLVWATFVLGRRVWSAALGLGAALLVATSPAFLNQLLQPMSDVPVAAWWTVALVLALHGTPRAAAGAGLMASLAILTRPNLAPLAVVVGLFLIRNSEFEMRNGSTRPSLRLPFRIPHSEFRIVILYAAGLIPGVAAVALVNARLYGGPLQSGYGSFGDLYALGYATENLARYARWTVETQSPVVFLGLVAPWIRTKRAWLLVTFVLGVWASYIFYFVFDEWMYLRFLLPALPVMIVLSLMVLAAIFTISRARLVLAIAVLGLAVWQVRQAEALDVFSLRRQLARYEIAGRFAAARLRPSAFIAGEHSGSLWFYTQQPIVRWDLIAPEALDRTLEHLRARGLSPHLVLEAWEVPRFRQRFTGTSSIGALDWPASAEVRHRTRVRIFSVDDRARFLAGTTIRTRRIW